MLLCCSLLAIDDVVDGGSDADGDVITSCTNINDIDEHTAVADVNARRCTPLKSLRSRLTIPVLRFTVTQATQHPKTKKKKMDEIMLKILGSLEILTNLN